MGELQQDDNNSFELDSFVASGRTGRRNALADLGVENTSDPGLLADRLTQQLNTGRSDEGPSSTSTTSKMVQQPNQHQQTSQQQQNGGYVNNSTATNQDK
uniref:Uncharacterized protein n=1 Tax=Globodera pallida TaxID=36090 RepID=A0A183BTH3_GLOPA